ncbi:MAG: hypothetical protein CMG66_02440 [Candidatus Marinimicrobia bacterium]|nr:hypothetical protein [Candidatus Neomarinimicrobiota bacterium]|tara:strand:+ start:34719 stop:37034 length:2316 start_codon:yes stop_codon:yes gene_type:complete
MNYILKLLFLSALCAIGPFKGQVVDVSDNPIKNANVQIVDMKNSSTLTDEDGYFIIDSILEKEFSVKVSHIGYEDSITPIDYSSDELYEIILFETPVELDRILVTGLRKEAYVKDTPVLTHVINSNDISNTTYTNVKDILEMKLPNVQNVVSSHAGTSNNRVKIQGLDNKYILFLIDGARVSGEFAGNLDFNMLNLSDVDKIEIVEGGMSSLYGSSAIGGVVNIITKKKQNPYWLDISYLNEDPMVISQSLAFGLNYKNIHYNINIDKKESDGYDLTPLENNVMGPLIKTLEAYKTISVKHGFTYNFSENTSVELNVKDYSNEIYQYESHLCQMGCQNPFSYYKTYKNNSPRFKDNRYGFKFLNKNEESTFKVFYNFEEYRKNSHFFNYSYESCSLTDCNNPDNLIEAEFLNATNTNESLLVQYDFQFNAHNLTFGFEKNDDEYASFNIYKYDLGDVNNDGECGDDIDDCLVESIFNSQNGIKQFSKKAFFIGNQISLDNDNIFSVSIRKVKSENYTDNLVYSMAYLFTNNSTRLHDVRFNYSKGFRTPAIKELYYNFQGHSPPVIGNPDLEPTTNDFFSISFDKKDLDKNYSFELFYNDIKNLIGVKSTVDEFDNNILLYSNFSSVIFYGINCHYESLLNDKNNIKFVYNYTHPESDNKEALELISEHSLALNYSYKVIKNKFNISVNMKYSGDKIIYDGDDIITLEDYIMADALAKIKINDYVGLKFGYKNLFHYKDDRRFLSDSYEKDLLSAYDPGGRFVVGIDLKFK